LGATLSHLEGGEGGEQNGEGGTEDSGRRSSKIRLKNFDNNWILYNSQHFKEVASDTMDRQNLFLNTK
jgi:hypothetical protein